MENGCFCCTLQPDLVDQIISLTKKRKFNYMLIEASGAEFYSNLGSMKTYEQGDTVGTIAELMMEQVEFSNVVVLNKVHLFCYI